MRDSVVWQWVAFDQLSNVDLYTVLAARQAVFVVEQNCVFADIDGIDPRAYHLLAWRSEHDERQLVGYLRCVPPGVHFAEASLGRVLSAQAVRGSGLGRELVARGIAEAERQFPGQRLRIAAQSHLVTFYCSFGFQAISEPYDEFGITHVEMLR